MSWIGNRLDHLGSAAFGAAGGLVFSQAPAFVQAYLQRLGGHIDEARRTVDALRDGTLLAWLDDQGRIQSVAELSVRLEQLEQMRERLLDAPPWWRPARLLEVADWSIARRAAEDFVPAVPLSPDALLWTALGIVVAALCWDLVKLPGWWWSRHRARRADTAVATTQRSRTRR
ncbi:MAG: DUF2937 family protein [Wenzhouxiangellaceae bacterium]